MNRVLFLFCKLYWSIACCSWWFWNVYTKMLQLELLDSGPKRPGASIIRISLCTGILIQWKGKDMSIWSSQWRIQGVMSIYFLLCMSQENVSIILLYLDCFIAQNLWLLFFLTFSLNIILNRTGESNWHCSNPSLPTARPWRPGDVIGKQQHSLVKWHQYVVYYNFVLFLSCNKTLAKAAIAACTFLWG